MAILAHAPFLTVLGALAASLALYERTSFPLVLFLSLPFAAGLALCSYEREIKGQREVLAAVLAVTFLCALRIFNVFSQPEPVFRAVQAEGTVSLVRPWGRQAVAVLNTPEGGFLLRLPFATLVEGTRLRVEGITRPLRGSSKGFDERRYWRAHGAVAWLSPSRMDSLPQQWWNLPKLRYTVWRALAIYMPPLTGAYLRAGWTGQRDDALNKAHRSWGTSHLLAVSGFHVSLVLLCAAPLLGKRRVLPLSLLLWGYILLTGAAPSAMRAGLMFQAALLARLAGRPSSPVNGVCLAAVLLLAYSPFLFWDIGWRLSVLAALTLTAVGGKTIKNWAWLLISPAISLVTFPQVAATFNGFPLAGLVLNLFAPAFFSVAFSLASAVAVLRFAGVPLASRLLSAVEGGFFLWGKLADGLVALIPWTVPWNPLLAWVGTGALFGLLSRSLGFSWGRSAVLATAGSLTSFWLFL